MEDSADGGGVNNNKYGGIETENKLIFYCLPGILYWKWARITPKDYKCVINEVTKVTPVGLFEFGYPLLQPIAVCGKVRSTIIWTDGLGQLLKQLKRGTVIDSLLKMSI